jgi:hypothetical protein
MKKCSMCQVLKPHSAFAKATATKDLLQRGCKECKAAQYQRNKGKYKEGSRTSRLNRYKKLSKIKDKPCMDCKIKYGPYIMEFDHVRGEKIASIADLLQRASWQAILDEIDKCDLVCANCHRQRTYDRLQAAGKGCCMPV